MRWYKDTIGKSIKQTYWYKYQWRPWLWSKVSLPISRFTTSYCYWFRHSVLCRPHPSWRIAAATITSPEYKGFLRGAITNEQKESIIAQALSTDEGRAALAQAMVEPIRRSMGYQSVARKIFPPDPLPCS